MPKKLIYLLLITLILSFILLPSHTKLWDLERKNRELEGKIKELEEKNLALEEERKNLEREDPFYIEKAIRQKMGVVKKGEVVYKISTPEEKK